MNLIEVLSLPFLLLGSVLMVVTGIALLRLPDFFSRIHGAGISDTLGAGAVLLGFALQTGFSLVSVKLMMIMIFLALTGPVAAHALARAAFDQGVAPILGSQAAGEDEDEEEDDSRPGERLVDD